MVIMFSHTYIVYHNALLNGMILLRSPGLEPGVYKLHTAPKDPYNSNHTTNCEHDKIYMNLGQYRCLAHWNMNY